MFSLPFILSKITYAVVCRFPEDEESALYGLDTAKYFKAYQGGDGVDAIAGAEALISRVISKSLGVPCAHAPAFEPWPVDNTVSPKCCSEELGYTFLPCILSYLERSPDLLRCEDRQNIHSFQQINCIRASDVDSVVVPVDALGGPAVLALMSAGALIVAVQENETSMQSTAEALHLQERVLHVRSYAEAAGILAAHREGILLDTITRDVQPIPVYDIATSTSPA